MKDAHEAADFLVANVAQGTLTEEGNYAVDLQPQHANEEGDFEIEVTEGPKPASDAADGSFDDLVTQSPPQQQ